MNRQDAKTPRTWIADCRSQIADPSSLLAPWRLGGSSWPLECEDCLGLLQRGGQAIDLPLDVVEVDRRARRRRHAKPGHQRLAAVVPRAHAQALLVEDRRQVVRVDLVER